MKGLLQLLKGRGIYLFLTPRFLPGSQPFLLYRGSFDSSNDDRSALFIFSDGRTPFKMTFETQEIADGIVRLNGRSSIFKLMCFDGIWQIHGCHPHVLSDPTIRPFSKLYDVVEKERTPNEAIVDEVVKLSSDAGELLRKASQSSSSYTSPSTKARIGPVSISTSLSFDEKSAAHRQIRIEMEQNSFIMDKLRYSYTTILLLQNILSRLVDVKAKGDLIVKGRCFQDSSLSVCFYFD
jgi:hypothetical protein